MIPRKGEELDGISNSAMLLFERILIHINDIFQIPFWTQKQVDNRAIVMQIKRLADAFQVSTA